MTLGVHPSRRWGFAAAGWSALFAALHLYWAFGGSVGLAESAGERLAAERPVWFVVVGLYGVAVLLVVATALGLVLARGLLVGRRGWALPLVGAGIAAILLLRAIGVELLLLTDTGYGGGDISPAQRWWSLVLWNPWFLLGGTSFALAALAARRAR